MTDSFFLDLARSDDDYFYADSVTRRTVQWPLALSWYAASGSTDPNVLLNDNPAEYLVYSGGVHSTSVMLNRLERIGGISLNVVSGSYVSVGVIVGETLNDPVPNFYGWPATTSGTALRTELYFPTKYENLPPAPSELLVPLAGSGQFNIVFPEPVFNRSFTVIHSGLGEYAISQILPRRATGAFDLEVNAIKAYHVSADLIDTIALQVSESIVVSPDIPDKSITGAKILDGTISGVIIAPGTITSNEIAAGTITGNKIAANTISGALMTAGTITFDKIASKTLTSGQIADASITGANIVAGTVSGVLITDSAITASKIAANTITGDRVVAGTISGSLMTAGTITFDKIASKTLTSDQIADASITGSNIVAGTVSGVLITDSAITASKIAAGTITGNKIAANTISGVLITAGTITSDKLQVNQLDAIAANMGTLVVNSGVSIGTSGYLWAGAGSALSPQNGIKLYTENNVSKITAYGAGQPQLEISTSGSLFTYPSGFVRLNRQGLTMTTTYSGTAVLDSNFGIVGAKSPLTSAVQTEGVLKYTSQQGKLNSILYTTNETDGGVYTAFQTGVVYSGVYQQKSTADVMVAGNSSSLLLQAAAPSGFSTVALTASGEDSEARFYANKSKFYGQVFYNALTDPILTLGDVHGYTGAVSSYSPTTPYLGEVAGGVQVDSDFFGFPRKSFVFTKRNISAFEQEVVAAINGEEAFFNVPLRISSTISGLAPQPNLLSNGNFINNSTNGYGSVPDDWFLDVDLLSAVCGGGFVTPDYTGIRELEQGFTMRGNWYLNESSGNALDYSGSSRTASQVGTVTRDKQGPMANSPVFNATANYFTYTDSSQVMNNGNGFVVSAIVQVTSAPTSGGNQQSFCGFFDSDNNETTVGVQGNNGFSYFYFQLKLPSGQGVITLTHPHLVQLGKWYHVVAQYVRDPGINRLVLWVNGTKAYVDNGATARSATTSNVLGIGCAGNGNQRFSGRVNALTWWSDKGVNYLSTALVRQMFSRLLYSGIKIVPSTSTALPLFQQVSKGNLQNFRGKYIRFSAEVYLENALSSVYCTIEDGDGFTDGTVTSETSKWVQVSVLKYIDSAVTSLTFYVNAAGGSYNVWIRNCYAIEVGENAGNMNDMGVSGSDQYVAKYDHSKEDWRRFPKLLTLDYPIYHMIPWMFEENRWYDVSAVTQLSGGNSPVTTNVMFMWSNNQVSYSASLLQLTSTQTYFYVFPPIRHSTNFDTYSAAHCNVIIAGTAQADIGFIRFVTTNDYWILYPRFNLLGWSNTGNKAVRIPFFTYRCDAVEDVE